MEARRTFEFDLYLKILYKSCEFQCLRVVAEIINCFIFHCNNDD